MADTEPLDWFDCYHGRGSGVRRDDQPPETVEIAGQLIGGSEKALKFLRRVADGLVAAIALPRDRGGVATARSATGHARPGQ